MYILLLFVVSQGGYISDGTGPYSYKDVFFQIAYSKPAFIVVPVTYSGETKPARKDAYNYYPLISEIHETKFNICVDGDEAFWLSLGS